MHSNHRAPGFTLIELMIVVAIIAILAAIAYPAYTRYVVRSNRSAAEACLSQYANYMERYYTTNLRYDQDSDGTANTLPLLNCASSNQTGDDYSYQFATGKGGKDDVSASGYVLEAVPKGIQQQRDTQCATLSLDQTGKRGVSGSGSVKDCW